MAGRWETVPPSTSLPRRESLISAVKKRRTGYSIWLPKRALDFSFNRNLLVQGVGASEKYAYMVDALVRPRLHFLFPV